jgi:hypothetical protein
MAAVRQGRGEHDLLDLVHPSGHRAIARISVVLVGDSRPVATEALVVLSSQQHCRRRQGEPDHVVAGSVGHRMGNDPAHVVLATGAIDPPVERQRDVGDDGATGCGVVHVVLLLAPVDPFTR